MTSIDAELDAAAYLLMGNGWTKGAMVRDTGCMCVSGALLRAAYPDIDLDPARDSDLPQSVVDNFSDGYSMAADILFNVSNGTLRYFADYLVSNKLAVRAELDELEDKPIYTIFPWNDSRYQTSANVITTLREAAIAYRSL